jgi:hypothetical protein
MFTRTLLSLFGNTDNIYRTVSVSFQIFAPFLASKNRRFPPLNSLQRRHILIIVYQVDCALLLLIHLGRDRLIHSFDKPVSTSVSQYGEAGEEEPSQAG